MHYYQGYYDNTGSHAYLVELFGSQTGIGIAMQIYRQCVCVRGRGCLNAHVPKYMHSEICQDMPFSHVVVHLLGHSSNPDRIGTSNRSV